MLMYLKIGSKFPDGLGVEHERKKGVSEYTSKKYENGLMNLKIVGET